MNIPKIGRQWVTLCHDNRDRRLDLAIGLLRLTDDAVSNEVRFIRALSCVPVIVPVGAQHPPTKNAANESRRFYKTAKWKMVK